MELKRIVWLLLVPLLTALRGARAAPAMKYFTEGGKMVLEPKVSATITNVLWKHRGDLLAEWVKGLVDLTYYDTFNGRTTLNTTTGRLEITKMTKADAGDYTLEINSKVHPESYTAMAIKEVPQPAVWLRPLACTHETPYCTMICEGRTPEGTPEDTKEAEPVTYRWRRDGDAWEKSENELNISKDSAGGTRQFSCQMENPVSTKQSEPKDNPFYEAPPPTPPPPSPHAIAGGVVVGLVVIVLVGLGVYKKDVIKARFNRDTANISTNPVNGRETNDGSAAASEYKLVDQKPESDTTRADV